MISTVNPKPARSSAALFAFGLCIALLVIPLVVGNAAARLGAGGALAAMLLGLVTSVRRLQRIEYAEAADPPSVMELVKEAVAYLGRYFVYLAAYIAFVLVAVATPASGARPPAWKGPLMAGLAAIALVAAMATVARVQWRKEGVERQVFLESTCIAFFITVVTSAAYALFEVLADAPQISLWSVWSLGMLTWAVTGSVRTRRLS